MRLIEPLGLIAGEEATAAVAAGRAAFLGGGPLAFSLARLLPDDRLCSIEEIPPDWRDAFRRLNDPAPCRWPRQPQVMGVLNVTPDSFSDGGKYRDVASAIAAGLTMVAAGASIIDVGGESTRPGSKAVPPRIEQGRILPVIAGLVRQGVSVSVDTRNAATMAAALDAGARIVNDVSALTHDPRSGPLLARSDALVLLMHTRGTPATMMRRASYKDVALEVTAELAERLKDAEAAGIAPERIALDPGVGFAKTTAQNLALLARLPLLFNLGHPLAVGVSRKRFIGQINGVAEPSQRIAGSLSAALFVLSRGASVVRVHDVRETVQALEIWQSLTSGEIANDRRLSAEGDTVKRGA